MSALSLQDSLPISLNSTFILVDCKWGDRYMDCRGADCADPKIREYCCETCSTLSVPQVTTTLSPLSPGIDDFVSMYNLRYVNNIFLSLLCFF